MHIETASWKKDSFGLFDFECKELQKHSLRHDGTGKLIREQKLENNDKRKPIIKIKSVQEKLSTKVTEGLNKN